MGRGFGEEGGRKEGLNDGLRLRVFGRSINDHDHLEMVVGTKARFGGCMGQTEGCDMTKGRSLALTLMNYEQTNFASDGQGVTVPAFRNPKSQKLFLWHHAKTKTCSNNVNKTWSTNKSSWTCKRKNSNQHHHRMF